MQRLKRFLRLSRRHRYLLFEALAVTCAVRVSLEWLTVQKLQRLSQRTSRSNNKVSADRIVWALHGAASFVPGATCLVRALAAQTLLLRHGYRPRLTIGVEKNRERFAAHAWVSCGNEIVIGAADARNYTSLLSLESQGR